MSRKVTVFAVLFFLMLCSMFLMTACNSENQAVPGDQGDDDSGEMPQHVVIATLPGSALVITEGLASLIQDEVGISAAPQMVTGTRYPLLIDGTADVAYDDAETILGLFKGQEPCEEVGKHPVRLIATIATNQIAAITWKGSGIEKFSDVKGKRFMYDYPASLTTTLMGDLLLKANGLTEDDVTVLSLNSINEAVDAIKDKTADLVLHPSAIEGSAQFVELAMTTDVEFISLSGEEVNTVLDDLWYFQESEFPAGTYKGQEAAVTGVGNKMSYIAFADLSEDFVYAMMKVLFDDVEFDSPGRFTRYHPSSGAFTLELALSGEGLAPFHAGAVRYYKERDLWTDDLEETQQALLNEVGQEY